MRPLSAPLRRGAQLANSAAQHSWVVQTVALMVLCLLGFLALVAFDWVVSHGLWGEWAFAMIACSFAIWLIGRYSTQKVG
jgi:hypothetical protein